MPLPNGDCDLSSPATSKGSSRGLYGAKDAREALKDEAMGLLAVAAVNVAAAVVDVVATATTAKFQPS